MDYATIQRELYIDAAPERVFEIVSSAAHVIRWWADEADFTATPGSRGELAWGDKATAHAAVVEIAVVDADPPRLFSFRWLYPEGQSAVVGNSLLVRFELECSGAGTTLRLSESGFGDMAWVPAALEEYYAEHSAGWDIHLSRLLAYAPSVSVAA